MEDAYGHAIGNIFLAASPLALVAIVAIALIPNIPLSTLNAAQQRARLEAEADDAAEEKAEA